MCGGCRVPKWGGAAKTPFTMRSGKRGSSIGVIKAPKPIKETLYELHEEQVSILSIPVDGEAGPSEQTK